MPEPLPRETFAVALRNGRGNACLHVQQFGLSGIDDIVLDACLKDLSYDPQCESSRARWLLGMFQNSREYLSFSSAILSSLERETNTWDLEQLCELAALMTKRGDEKAHEALRRRVLRQAESTIDTWVGTHELVSLDGVATIPDLARRYGRLLANDPEESPPSLDELTENRDIRLQSEMTLKELAGSDAEIRAYLKYSQGKALRPADGASKTPEELRQEARARIRREFPLERILRDAADELGDFPGRYAQFGKSATPEELGIVLQHLGQETAEGVCQRLLWVFRSTSLPEIHPKIWELAASKNHDVRVAAIEALAQLRDERIGAFGRSKLCSQNFTENDSEILNLFIRNYQFGDEDLIMRALAKVLPTSQNAHRLCWSVLELAEENPSSRLSHILNWAYEMTPCTICRLRTLRLLAEFGGLTPAIIQECRFDADEDIQQFAQSVAN